MKKYLVLLVILAFTHSLFSQVDLETVWTKELGVQINFAKFSADGNFIYCAIGKTIQKMEAKTGDFVSMFDNKNVIAISDMAISNDGKIIMTDAASQGLNIWDAQSEKVIKYIPYEKTSGKDGVLAADLSGDGRYIVAWVTEYIDFNKINGYLILYDLLSNIEIKRISYAQGTIRNIKISHDGKYFVTGSYYQDSFTNKFHNLLILWETGTWKQIAVLEDIETGISGEGYKNIIFSFDDKNVGIYTQFQYKVKIFDLTTNTLAFTSDYLKYTFNVEFLADQQHFILNRANLNLDSGFMDLYNIKSRNFIKSYDDYSVFTSSKTVGNSLYIFTARSKNRFSVLKSSLTDIALPEITINKFNIYSENGQVIIETSGFSKGLLRIIITDLIGKKIYTENIDNLNENNRLKLGTTLPAGLYICKIVAGTKEYSQKFEIVR